MRATKASLLALALVALSAIALLIFSPYGPHTETFVDLPPHTSTSNLAAQLQRSGVIRSRLAFDLLHLLHPGTLKAGEYRFDHPAPLTEVYARITRGDVYTRTLVIPEGFNLFDIAAAVEQAGLAPAPVFLTAARQDAALVHDLNPHASSLEGFLFPDTYRFSRHTTPSQMLATMVKRFRQKTAALLLTNSSLILASIIEKEVRDPAERPLVAGVFTNRLDRNMPLATDPTVIYAALLDGRNKSPSAAYTPKTIIFRSDLDASSPYNTYRHPGLPPGPICNPGIPSILAALHPTPTDFLYFVADANGHTRFAASLPEHNRNVLAFRAAAARP